MQTQTDVIAYEAIRKQMTRKRRVIFGIVFGMWVAGMLWLVMFSTNPVRLLVVVIGTPLVVGVLAGVIVALGWASFRSLTEIALNDIEHRALDRDTL